ncbi:DNA repair protein RecN [Burkholderia pseudomallei MSHR5608]|nr:DNA repair protein RecN [Burkholderia pseudomallei MSHR5608]
MLNGRVQPGGDAEARQEARGSGRGPRVITRQLTVDRPLAIRRHSLPSGSRQPPTAGRRPKSRRGRRAPRHAVSISFACLRVVAVISRPPSIRATSSIRLARSSGTTVDTVPPSPSSPFAT